MLATVDGVASRATPHGRASCVDCQAPMIAKCGPIVVWHWAHAVGADCEAWSEPESDWHLRWKERFYEAGCQIEVPITRGDEHHRADVVLPGGRVVELQHGYLPADAIRCREAFYGDMVWIYDASRFWERISFRQVRFDEPGFKWTQPAKTMLLHHRPVLWHADAQVYWVRWVRRYRRGTYGGFGTTVAEADTPARMIGALHRQPPPGWDRPEAM
jgi:hypothetical protein